MNEIEIRNLLSTIGLCEKAGRLICGTEQLCDAMRGAGKRPLLVIEASDTSPNTHKRLNDRCAFYGVKIVRIEADALALGYAVGKRCSVAAVGITDKGLTGAVEKKLQPSAKAEQ